MAKTAVAFPILPGKEEDVRHFASAALGARRAELDASFRGFGIREECWYLQQTPQGYLLLVTIDAEDPLRMFQEWAASQAPFDVWFKEQAGACAGIDFSQPIPGLPLEIFAWS